jgi:UDP-N-acetylglucosamine:LPS N-acetylglucosamine transferase
MKICIVSSAGGHLNEVRALRPAYQDFDHFYVVNQPVPMTPDMQDRLYIISHSERDLLFFANLVEAWKILRKERPDVLLSTGAGAIVPFSIIGRLFFGTKVIFVESLARVTAPSLTGRIMYRLTDLFFYQHEQLRPHFPSGRYGGSLI